MSYIWILGWDWFKVNDFAPFATGTKEEGTRAPEAYIIMGARSPFFIYAKWPL
jgi:hypothetical protein